MSKPLIFSSATFSFFSFALWPAVAAANARPNTPVVPVCGLFAFPVPNIDEDCDVIGNNGFELLDLTSNGGLGNDPNVKGAPALSPVISFLLASSKLLLEEAWVEAADPRLLKPPNVKLVEGGCLAASPRYKRLLELEVLDRGAFREVKAAFLLKAKSKAGVET